MRHATTSPDTPRGDWPDVPDGLERGVVALYKAARCAQILAVGDPLDPGLSRILITVARLGQARPSAIAADNHIDVSTASRHVDSLARLRFVKKASDPHDARACLVELTDSGRELLGQMLRNRAAAIAPALESWSEPDREQLVRLLVKLSSDLNERVTAAKETTV